MFSNFVSLGAACPTASSMSKYGLRSFSGPFDWLVTSCLDWVLYYMENGFNDFLEKENLERFKGSPLKFRDRKSGFVFLHDEEYPFEDRFYDLKQKYQKRIDRFMKEIKKPTCFLRSVISSYELDYISSNVSYIEQIIKSKNSESELVLLIHRDAQIPKSLPFKYFIMSGEFAKGHETLRSWFDGADGFLEFCADNYSPASLMKNIAYDQKKEIQFWHKRMDKVSQKFNTLVKLCNFDFSDESIPRRIIIYGAGHIGCNFYKKIKNFCEVICFVDKNENGKELDGIPIVGIEEVNDINDLAFIVTATHNFEKIKQEIKWHYKTALVISLDDLLIDNPF